MKKIILVLSNVIFYSTLLPFKLDVTTHIKNSSTKKCTTNYCIFTLDAYKAQSVDHGPSSWTFSVLAQDNASVTLQTRIIDKENNNQEQLIAEPIVKILWNTQATFTTTQTIQYNFMFLPTYLNNFIDRVFGPIRTIKEYVLILNPIRD